MFLFSWGQRMAWKACSPWQREFNTHQKFTLFHENGRFFLPAHLNSYFSNSLACASEQLFSSTGTYACPRPNTHLPADGILLRATQVPLINTNRSQTAHFRYLPLQWHRVSHEWHIQLTAVGQRDCPRWNQINPFAFASWIFYPMLTV